jgi:restriction system protein
MIQGTLLLIALVVGLFVDATRLISGVVLGLFGIAVLLVILVGSAKAEKEKAHLKSARIKIKAIVDEHFETLARRRLMLVKVDSYGVVDAKGWNKEVQHFIDKVVRPRLTDDEAASVAAGERLNSVFQELIEDRVSLRADQIGKELQNPSQMSPQQFERWCADLLARHGWTANTTKGSGDQGADVVAEKQGFRVVLQCKLYSGTVGNKAVQEAFAAQRHYAAGASAVITNAEFTSGARDLANTTGVLVLHYSELTRLDELLGLARPLPEEHEASSAGGIDKSLTNPGLASLTSRISAARDRAAKYQ